MEIRFNVTGTRRKELAMTAGEITGEATVYKGAPSFAYAIGGFTLDKNGTLTYDGKTDIGLVEKLIEQLSERGFDLEVQTENLVIEMPLEGFTEQALKKPRATYLQQGGVDQKSHRRIHPSNRSHGNDATVSLVSG